MGHVILEQQQARYDLERKLHTLQLREEELAREVESSENIFMTLFDAMTEYEHSLACKMKKLLRKPDPELEELRSDTTLAESQLKQAEDELEACRKEKAKTAAQLVKLPSFALLWIRAKKEPDIIKIFAEGEARYCAERLIPLMEVNRQVLRELADFLRENERAVPFPQSEFNRLFDQSIAAGEACRPYLARFENAMDYFQNLFFSVKEYYYDPKDFIWNAKNGPSFHDRAAAAMKQVKSQKESIEMQLKILHI